MSITIASLNGCSYTESMMGDASRVLGLNAADTEYVLTTIGGPAFMAIVDEAWQAEKTIEYERRYSKDATDLAYAVSHGIDMTKAEGVLEGLVVAAQAIVDFNGQESS